MRPSVVADTVARIVNGSCEHVIVHQVREALGRHRHSGRVDLHHVRIDPVEDRWRCRQTPQMAGEIVHTYRHTVSDVQHDMAHPRRDENIRRRGSEEAEARQGEQYSPHAQYVACLVPGRPLAVQRYNHPHLSR